VNSRPISQETKLLAELFCARCARLDQRALGKCPKGQTTCGAQIDASYLLNKPYAGLPGNSIVTIKDIFWSVDADYATVTIVDNQKHRFGVACTLLEKNPEEV
jgi:hypothetical protein